MIPEHCLETFVLFLIEIEDRRHCQTKRNFAVSKQDGRQDTARGSRTRDVSLERLLAGLSEAVIYETLK